MKKILLSIFFILTFLLVAHTETQAATNECSGEGLVFSIAEGYLDDNGNSGYDDSLEFYCRKNVIRLCLSGEACPWRTNIASADNLVCGMSGIGTRPTYDANGARFGGSYDVGYVWYAFVKGWRDVSVWNGYNAYMCSSDGTQKKMVQFDDNGSRITGGVINDDPDPYEPPRPNPRPPIYDPLYVVCYPDDSSVEEDDRVTWSADVYGGTGSYSYDWSGSEGLDGSGNDITIRYDNDGNKTATVRVTSGTQTVTRSCGTVYVYEEDNYDYDDDDDDYYGQLSVSCYPDRYIADVGERMTWQANASGGNGSYTYSWSGTEGLNARGRYVSVAYDYAGRKSATVRVTSRGRTVTRSCAQSVTVGGDYQYNGNTSALSVSCSASPTVGTPNTAVTWTAYPTGGNGAYTYIWSGSDGFSGSQKSVATAYKTNGNKTAMVTVYSAGKSATRSCGTNVLITGPIVKKPIVKKPTISKVETPKPGDSVTDSAARALVGVPWFIVSILVIIVLFGTVIYLIVTKK